MLTLDAIVAIARTLSAHDVRYVLIGGIAMRLHGSAHLTDDLDICYGRDAPNLHALVDAFATEHPRLRGVPAELPFLWDERTLRNGQNFTLTTDLGNFDMLAEPAGIDSFQGLWDRAVAMQIGDVTVRVASIDDLIAMKRAANRPKDQVHVLELEALRKLIRESSLQDA